MVTETDNLLERPPQTAEPPAAPISRPEVLPEGHGKQHPIGIYLKIWGYLFVLSTLSYLVDYFGLEGGLRWALILTFMFLKAGLIVAVFMHMAWERLALIYAILMPPLCLGTLVLLMAIEADYTFWTRIIFFGRAPD